MTTASILVNNHNYGAFLGDAIDSALAQDWADVQVVVVDDGSTDDSAAVIDSYGDRIVPVWKENGGQASAFNRGFDSSSGDVVFLLDADDWFAPQKVRTVVEALDGQPALGWCFHPLAYAGGLGPAQTGAVGVVDARSAMRAGRAPGVLAPATTGLAFRRELLDQVLPMPEDVRITADNYVKAVAVSLAPGLALDLELAVQRIHASNAYTGVPHADPNRAAIELQIANALHDRWPHLRRYAHARGLGALRAATSRGEVEQFMRSRTPRQRIEVRARRLLWRVA